MAKFELPIYYLENKHKIEQNIIDDLELLTVNDEIDSRRPLLESIYNPVSKIGKRYLEKHSEYFTSNKHFLKDTQKIITNWKTDDKLETKQTLYDDFYDMWENIKSDDTFVERYYYVDVDFFKFLNNSGQFLQILSIYNLLSPIITLIIPIILLIVPFFMLKFNGVSITMSAYCRVLKDIFSKHALGSIGNIIGEVSWEKRVYGLISIAFYLFSVYQNSLVCYRFYKNFYSIHKDLFLLKQYLITTLENIEILEKNVSKYKTYDSFTDRLQENKHTCTILKENLDKIKPFSLKNMTQKSCEIGYVMKYFYEIHTNIDLHNTIEYTMGINAYMEHIHGINALCREKILNKCSFGKMMKMQQTVYPCLIGSNPVTNDIHMNKNVIITGPNASGKTTMLKTILFNQIFSQSIGFGFYSKATVPLYSHIHCYLNIPDTSGRDSLFQAEARRCKEIIDSLSDNKKHFCIFDELFSGTNPNEASSSSYGFIKYLNNQKNIDFILTTHLTDICYRLDREVINTNMKVNEIDAFNFDFDYTYTMINGISCIKGGLKVLSDLHYPKIILDNSIQYFKNE